MPTKRNLQVSAKKPQQVLRRKSSKKPPQHLSAQKRSRSVTVKKRLPLPDLATLISLINQVPDGLPSLRELRQLAREYSNKELGLPHMGHSYPERLDKLIFQTIQQKAPALLAKLPAPPDMSDPRSRLPWITYGIRSASRAQLLYCYEYMVEGKVALGAIADSAGGSIGPFHLEHHLDEDAEGKLTVHPHPILKAVEHVERKRIRRCPICKKIYWAERKDQPACSKPCNNVRRSRIQRGTFPRPEVDEEKS